MNDVNMSVVNDFVAVLTSDLSLSEFNLPENIEILAKFKMDIKNFLLREIKKYCGDERQKNLLCQFVATDYYLTYFGVFIHRIWQLFYCFEKVNSPSKMAALDLNPIIQRCHSKSEINTKMKNGDLAFKKFMTVEKKYKSITTSQEHVSFGDLGVTTYDKTRFLKKCVTGNKKEKRKGATGFELSNCLRTFELSFEIKFNDELRSRLETICNRILIIVVHLLLSCCLHPQIKNVDLQSYFAGHIQSDYKEYKKWPLDTSTVSLSDGTKPNLDFANDLVLCCVKVAGGSSLADYSAGKHFVHRGRYSKMQSSAKEKLAAIKEEKKSIVLPSIVLPVAEVHKVGHKRSRSSEDLVESLCGEMTEDSPHNNMQLQNEFAVEIDEVSAVDDEVIFNCVLCEQSGLSVHRKLSPLLQHNSGGGATKLFTPSMLHVAKTMSKLSTATESVLLLDRGLISPGEMNLDDEPNKAGNNNTFPIDRLSLLCDAVSIAERNDNSCTNKNEF